MSGERVFRPGRERPVAVGEDMADGHAPIPGFAPPSYGADGAVVRHQAPPPPAKLLAPDQAQPPCLTCHFLDPVADFPDSPHGGHCFIHDEHVSPDAAADPLAPLRRSCTLHTYRVTRTPILEALELKILAGERKRVASGLVKLGLLTFLVVVLIGLAFLIGLTWPGLW